MIRELANECGFEIDEEGSAVIDHLNFDIEDDGKVSFYIKSKLILGKSSIHF